MGSFSVVDFTKNYMGNYRFCSVDNYRVFPKENFSIISGNKSEIILTEDSISNIPPGINSSVLSEDNYNSEIPPGINLPIPSGVNYNSTIPSRYIFSVSPRDIPKIPSGDSYKSTPTNSKVNLVDPESPSTNPLMIPSTIPSIVPTNLPKLRYSDITQNIWSRILNNKKDQEDLKLYDGN